MINVKKEYIYILILVGLQAFLMKLVFLIDILYEKD